MPFDELIAQLRAQYSETAFRQLSYSPVYFAQEDIMAAIDQLERFAAGGVQLDSLQKLAVEMLLGEHRDNERFTRRKERKENEG